MNARQKAKQLKRYIAKTNVPFKIEVERHNIITLKAHCIMPPNADHYVLDMQIKYLLAKELIKGVNLTYKRVSGHGDMAIYETQLRVIAESEGKE